MTKYNRFNIIYRLQKWMDSVPGQTFLNYAYSWGASIVILGALFKLTHLPGANTMLFIGMGTEVFVFFLSAFDRPFDKTSDGRVIPSHVTEEFLEGKDEDNTSSANGTQSSLQATATVKASAQVASPQRSVMSSQFVGNVPQPESTVTVAPQKFTEPKATSQETNSANAESTAASAAFTPQPTFVPQMTAEEAQALNEAQGNYVDELKKLVDTLGKVNEQSTRLTRDSEEMENLNRTLTGISKIYEMQLKGASQQVGTIDQINEQTRRMAQQIEQLNAIYARMIQAMTVNMRATQAPGTSGMVNQ
ncbi:MAG: gliding motility protein GldL [Prevotella sp.]|jgi:gliding motility-associated protein GldL